jgi:hypothetical protein
MFLVILLFLVILFYPYREHFSSKSRVKPVKKPIKPFKKPVTPLKNGLKESAITKLNREFDSLFEKSKNAIREDRDSYLKLYNALIVVK